MENKLIYVINNMKSLRVRSGFSQSEIAEKMCISRATYNSYETNPQKVTIGFLQELSILLNCKLSDFFMEY